MLKRSMIKRTMITKTMNRFKGKMIKGLEIILRLTVLSSRKSHLLARRIAGTRLPSPVTTFNKVTETVFEGLLAILNSI